MHVADSVATASVDETLRDVVIRMNEHPWGAACVIDSEQRLLGIVTDGDVRRLPHVKATS